jgi:hypothetical protein
MKVSELKAMLDKVPGHYDVGHAVTGVTGWVIGLEDVRCDHADRLCVICSDKRSDGVRPDEVDLYEPSVEVM